MGSAESLQHTTQHIAEAILEVDASTRGQQQAMRGQIRRGLQSVEGGVPLAGAVEAVAKLWPTIP